MLGRTEIALGLLRAFPQTQHWLYRQALLLYQHGLFEQAEKMIEEALEASHNRSEDTAAAEPASNGSGDDSPELRARLYTLLARIYSATGRSQEAEATFLFVRKRYGSASIAPVVLLAYFEFLSETGRGGEALEVLSEIEARFPDSPEYTLALGQVPSGKDTPGNGPQGQGSGAEISYAASPSRLLPKVPPPSFVPEKEETAEGSDLSSRQKLSEREVSPKGIPAQEKTPEQVSPTVPGRETAAAPPADAAPPAEQPSNDKPSTAKPPAEQPAIEPPPQPVQNVLVQTGSFRDPENAQYMVRDLKASGFAARVVEKTISGNLYYRVIIGSPQSVESAQILLLKLKDKNFEGVLLFIE